MSTGSLLLWLFKFPVGAPTGLPRLLQAWHANLPSALVWKEDTPTPYHPQESSAQQALLRDTQQTFTQSDTRQKN